jgi:hypothetical protein
MDVFAAAVLLPSLHPFPALITLHSQDLVGLSRMTVYVPRLPFFPALSPPPRI